MAASQQHPTVPHGSFLSSSSSTTTAAPTRPKRHAPPPTSFDEDRNDHSLHRSTSYSTSQPSSTNSRASKRARAMTQAQAQAAQAQAQAQTLSQPTPAAPAQAAHARAGQQQQPPPPPPQAVPLSSGPSQHHPAGAPASTFSGLSTPSASHRHHGSPHQPRQAPIQFATSYNSASSMNTSPPPPPAPSPNSTLLSSAFGGANSSSNSNVAASVCSLDDHMDSPGGASSTTGTTHEKEQRKQARMIRNRNAAQASRDRKKEHTVYLEQRVAQLEAQLAVPLPFVPPPSHGGSSTPTSHTSTLPSNRSSRSHSVSSSTTSVSDHPSLHGAALSAASSASAAPFASKIAELETEKENLRTRLRAEQMESSRLRERLESLEDKFKRFEQFLAAPLSTSAPDPITSHPSPANANGFPVIPDTTSAPALGPACSLNDVCGDDSMTIRSDFDDPMSPSGTSYSTSPSSVRSSSRKSSPSSSAHSSPISTRRSMLPNLTPHSDSSRLVAREVEISLPRKLSERALFINLERSALSPTLWI
ncbi:hypothetical protein MVLG_04330 [Microbotryum lychnidis-dioicae p1A1 Lamole]|uniref:BZIP domain-containing protein n=1 Tax=Microbotryum lychnidis-dioicae (strain p1A1 Lamole / MvSl-1064) TaxID=683840 RepID=U5HAW4_USTV1|nr:hypothetical protein MVLG_04330 [Microbotryum lychnidis-dioicae p1A1 Lamole]|eukprot:KDE05298.1 hypothetical protein MVLG_04330 [Microbotryum lychnidis-dioicae p1A1 Lamole]